MKSVFAVQSYQIDDWWGVVRPFVERCEVHQLEWRPDDVLRALRESDAQLWGVSKDGEIIGIFITQVCEAASGKFGRIWIASGEMKEGWDVLSNVIEPWFAEQGCGYIEIQGRKGWQRMLPDYEVHSVKLVKRLTKFH